MKPHIPADQRGLAHVRQLTPPELAEEERNTPRGKEVRHAEHSWGCGTLSVPHRPNTRDRSASFVTILDDYELDDTNVSAPIGPWLSQAIEAGLASLEASAASGTLIHYRAIGRTERFDDPEERVRADFWAELVLRYGYPAERIGVEVTVPDRLPRDAADLVVFRDDSRRRPFAVIECKRDGISDIAFEQAVEQAAGNGTWAKLRADYVGVVAGLTRRFLDFTDAFGALEREKNLIADLPARYGKPLEFKYTKLGKLDLRPVTRGELIVTLAKCHQTLWGGGRLSPPAAFGELCKLIFVKLHDETVLRKKGAPYEFQLRTGETSRDLAARIRTLYERQRERDPDVFTDTIRVDDQSIRTLVSHLEPLNLSATELDVKGVAFEQFMDGFFKGDFGQYFTPREIIKLAVEMIAPDGDDLIIDPACGSGGFLLHALDHVRGLAQEADATDAEIRQSWTQFAQRNLFGIEINEELTRVAKMNLIIHGDGHSNIVNSDALVPIAQLAGKNSGLQADRFDIVLTNPPFGATVTSATHPNLGDYDLGRQHPERPASTARKSQKTEIVFIERAWELLKPGTGHAAIVLPDGVLANSGTEYVREWILEHFQVLAVVSLPATAFNHYGAAVKSSLVLLRKRSSGEAVSDDEEIFMAAPSLIGYDASGRETANELPAVARAYQSHLATQAQRGRR